MLPISRGRAQYARPGVPWRMAHSHVWRREMNARSAAAVEESKSFAGRPLDNLRRRSLRSQSLVNFPFLIAPISRACDAQHRAVYSRVDPCGQPGIVTRSTWRRYSVAFPDNFLRLLWARAR